MVLASAPSTPFKLSLFTTRLGTGVGNVKGEVHVGHPPCSCGRRSCDRPCRLSLTPTRVTNTVRFTRALGSFTNNP